MSLVSIETYNLNGIIVITEDYKLVIDSEKKEIIVLCKDRVTTPVDDYEKDFVMQVDNKFRLPEVDALGNPIWENPEAPVEERVQKTIGEWDALEYYIDNKIITLKEAIGSAIRRKKGIDQSPYVFVRQ